MLSIELVCHPVPGLSVTIFNVLHLLQIRNRADGLSMKEPLERQNGNFSVRLLIIARLISVDIWWHFWVCLSWCNLACKSFQMASVRECKTHLVHLGQTFITCIHAYWMQNSCYCPFYDSPPLYCNCFSSCEVSNWNKERTADRCGPPCEADYNMKCHKVVARDSWLFRKRLLVLGGIVQKAAALWKNW